MVGVHRREDSLKLLGANLPLDELGLHFVTVTALVAVLVHLTELRLEHREELTVFLENLNIDSKFRRLDAFEPPGEWLLERFAPDHLIGTSGFCWVIVIKVVDSVFVDN